MRDRAFLVALLAGLAIRLVILWYTVDLTPKIADELQYVELAHSLVDGRGFAWASGELTSLRPPLYPALVAAAWTLIGHASLQAVRVLQIAISLATVALVFEIGRRAFNRRAGLLAAAAVWLYPDFIFLDSLLLTETLFTFALVVFVLLGVMVVQRPRWLTALACGFALGLGALTRSVLWPVPFVFCPLLVVVVPGTWRQKLTMPALVLCGAAVVIGPWAVRNTRLQHVVTIVDTMGGMNLRMGNYEYTPDDRMWDAVSLTGEKNWIYALTQEPPKAEAPGSVFTEGMKDKWAQRKAIEYMRAHPGTTIRRSLIKFGDFWGLERSFIAGVQQGLYSPPAWFTVLTFLLMTLTYPAVAVLGVAGMWLARPAWRVHAVMLLPVVLITGIHSVVFGHSRYHLPLVPVLAIYASALWLSGFREAIRAPVWARIGAAASVLVLATIWGREVLIVDAERLRRIISGLVS